MLNIYARTFMIATLTDVSEPLDEARETQVRKEPGWISRARRWVVPTGLTDDRGYSDRLRAVDEGECHASLRTEIG